MRPSSIAALACTVTLAGCALGHGGGTDDPDATTTGPFDAGGVAADAWIIPLDADEPPGADAAELEGRNGFPGDFPELVDAGGFGAGELVEGFGGDTTTDRAGNRAQLVRRPVILLHGNGVTTFDERFGMVHIAEMLRDAGYVDAEMWAPSYLGQGVSIAETPTPHRANIEDIRTFIDAVLEYTGVDAVDIVTHSLGCGLTNGYLRGLQSDGTFDPAAERFDRVSTLVCLGGALYGTGSGFLYEPEFNLDGTWITAGLTWAGVEDATPFGATAEAAMTAPATGQIPGGRPFKRTTALDDGARRIHYVALWANGDIVDGNLPFACALGGADLNQGFDLPDTLPGVLTPQLARHGHLVQDQAVVDAFLPYLDR